MLFRCFQNITQRLSLTYKCAKAIGLSEKTGVETGQVDLQTSLLKKHFADIIVCKMLFNFPERKLGKNRPTGFNIGQPKSRAVTSNSKAR